MRARVDWGDVSGGALAGGFFGFFAGVLSVVLVVVWALVTRLGRAPLALKPLLAIHLSYILLYVVVGTLIGVLWPLRRNVAGHVGLWMLATATGAMTIFSVSWGPPWAWSPAFWSRYGLAVVAFAILFGWPQRRAQRGGS